MVQEILNVALLSAHALYLMWSEQHVTSWFSNECHRGFLEIHKEESHVGVEGVQVEIFLNVWQTITSKVMCLALLVARMQWGSVTCVHLLLSTWGRRKTDITCAVNVMCGSLLQTIPHRNNFGNSEQRSVHTVFCIAYNIKGLQEGCFLSLVWAAWISERVLHWIDCT
jgi:hypothetical protein